MSLNSEFQNILMDCNICPRKCHVNRYLQKGYCNASDKIKINTSQLHFGEEPALSRTNGSATIFFSHCNLSCVFCQNFQISFQGNGKIYEIEGLAAIMLELQEQKAHNINLVTPTQYTLQIIEAIKIAKEKGLNIPIIWNSNAYEEVETLKKLDGLIDIYLPDLKYFDPEFSLKFSNASNYTEKAKDAIKEMYWQTGNFQIDNGIAKRGVMIRILNLPNNLNSIDLTLNWIYKNFGNDIYISLLSQYYPAHKAFQHPEINRGISQSEHNFALEIFHKYGFHNGYIQEISCSNEWTPDFNT